MSEIETVDRSIEELTGRQALQNRIQSLEEERTQLCDNTPCPLCGSVEHPYAHGKTPDLRKTDAQLNEARQQRKELEKAHREAAKEIAEIEAEMRVRLQSQKEESKRLSGLKEKSGALIEQLGLKNEAVPSYPEVNQKHEESQSRLNAFETKYTAYLKKGRDKEKAQKAYDKEYQKYFHLQQQLETLAATQNTHENHVHYLKQECLRLDQEHSALEISLLESVRAYGIFTFANAGLEAIKEDLAHRLDTWKQQLEARNHVEGEIQKVLPQITIQKDHLTRVKDALLNLRNEKDQTASKIEEMSGKRQRLFGSKNPDHEEESLKNSVDIARMKAEALKDEWRSLQHQQTSVESRIQELTQITQARAHKLQADEAQFFALIVSGGFPDLEAYQKALLSHEEREQLEHIKNSLETKKSDLSADKKAAEKRLLELNQDHKTEETLEALETQIQEATDLYDSVKERVVQLKMILSENEKKQAGAKTLQEKIDRQSKETDIWRRLSLLIGSADGKKFRDFAQKMTLEMMIAHANRQLVKMSDRYLLRQSKIAPLELEVVDNYQAGEERSVKNLSGGEGFIVSLSLALGLSQMSSSKVRVDTLFLDEGFGTLDERALEVALDTLSELHQEGKVIGLISHVAILKERISTQIRVQPISGGRSRIEGPGCSEIK